MAEAERLEVWLADGAAPRRVARLLDPGAGPLLEYDAAFLEERLELAPLMVPARSGVFEPGPRHLHRLRGLVADSIPDGFGLKVLYQALRATGRDPFAASPLQLLAAIGERGMGALVYRPVDDIWGAGGDLPALPQLAAEAARVEADDLDELPDALRRTAGSSAGARPKVTVALATDGRVRDATLPLLPDFRQVLVKFRGSADPAEQVALESAYLRMAAAAGLEVPAAETIALGDGAQALVLDRFDRVGDARRHVQTLAALLEIDFRTDLVDYTHLLDVTRQITRDFAEVIRAFRLAAFNVLARNRDDHAKNVSFVMAPSGAWRLAPAYDLTWGGAVGYHAMSVAGESRDPGVADLERLGKQLGLDAHQVRGILDEVRAAIAQWARHADAAEVPMRARRAVAETLI